MGVRARRKISRRRHQSNGSELLDIVEKDDRVIVRRALSTVPRKLVARVVTNLRGTVLSTWVWLLAVVASTGNASAEATIDWARGLVVAEGVGVADRHAPSPAAARGTSRRVAEAAARAQIAVKLGSLPLASGGVVADKAGDSIVKDRLERAVSSAVTVAADPQPDGAWRVTLGVAIEAIREAIDGRRTLPTGGDRGPPIIVVSGVAAKPSLGWNVGGTRVATRWVNDIPAWAADAPHTRATKTAAGSIAIAGPGVAESTLVIIQTSTALK